MICGTKMMKNEKILEIEVELEQILIQLGMDHDGNNRGFRWVKEVTLHAIFHPDCWKENYLELIGKREGVTREHVRQILYKAVWDNWTPKSAHVLGNHFGNPIQTKFECVKPNHIELVTLLSEQLREQYQIVQDKKFVF